MDDKDIEINGLKREISYLSFLVWKLSIRDLVTQHPKYEHNLNRTYVSTREKDFGVDDSKKE